MPPDVFSQDDLDSIRQIFRSQEGIICGSTEIFSTLAGNWSVDTIRNMDWDKAKSVAALYIAEQSQKVTVLQAEVSRIDSALSTANAKEQQSPLPDAALESIVESAVAQSNAFRSLALARQTRCGALRPANTTEKPMPADAFGTVVSGFSSALSAALVAAKATVSPASARRVCLNAIQGSLEEDPSSFCGELCSFLADTAGSLGHETRGGDSALLTQRKNDKANEMKIAMEEISKCNDAKMRLGAFEDIIERLDKDIEKAYAVVRAARIALRDAESDLEELQSSLKDQNLTLINLTGLMDGTGQKVEDARRLLQELQNATSNLSGYVTQGTRDVQDLSNKVQRAGDAGTVVQRLLELIDAVLFQISQLTNVALREPIRNLGLHETVRFQEYFPDPGATQEASNTGAAISALKAFCASNDTQQILAAVGGLELCSFGDASKVTQEILGALTLRSMEVQADLKNVKDWLNPHHGLDITAEYHKRLIEMGEPARLRESKAAIYDTNFYVDYLSQWELDKKFPPLIASFGRSLNQSKAALAALQDQMAAMQGQLVDRNQLQAAADAALQQALASHQVAQQNQAQAKQQFDKLVSQQRTVGDDLDQLRRALAEAEAKYRAAQSKLQETQRKATSMLELVLGTVPHAFVPESLLEDQTSSRARDPRRRRGVPLQ